MNLKAFGQILAPLRMAVSNMVARAVLSAIDDAKKLQSVQAKLLTEETRADLERFQQYGFTGVPLVGAEAIILFPNGIREGGVVICVDDRRYRLVGLEEGEVAMYNNAGAKSVFKADGSIETTSPVKTKTTAPIVEVIASTKITMTTPLVEASGDMTVAGTLTATTDVIGGGKSLKLHTHGGVTAGGGTSGPPT